MATSWEHLLGGYATNTLTDEEKRLLFEAALNDQTLFDSLADEEALKTLLADPEARQRILASLQGQGNPGESISSQGSRWGWFQQPSHLAWAGSLAALGLVLIFGWQMEKEWGPVVSQEQETTRSSSRDEVAFRPQKPSNESVASVQKEALERTATQIEGIEAGRQLTPEPAARVDTNKADRFKQIPAMAKKEDDTREKVQVTRRQRAYEQVAQAPPSSSASNQPKVGRTVQPLAAPEAPELATQDRAPQAVAPGRFADQVAEEASLSPPSAQELFYAASGFLSDEVIVEQKDKDRVDQTLRGAGSKAMKPSSKRKALSFPLERDVAGGGPVPTARGLRYSFVQQMKEGKDDEVEGRQITGNWAQTRLALESNVSGYLYVLASLGNGRWQRLVPIDPGKMGQTEAGIKVNSFQRVEFSLGELTNALGNLVVSSLTVLLSPHSLDDLGQWLGSEVDMSEFQIERAEGAVFVVKIEPGKETPLLVDISLRD